MFVLYKMPRKSASKKQRGGSLASDRVMKNLDTAAATHDHVVSPRIRTKSELGNTNTYQLTGGACGACGGHKHIEGFRGCGATAPTQAGGSNCHKREEFGNCGGSTAPTQAGGSRKSIKRRKSKGKKVSKSRKSRKQRGGAKHTPGAHIKPLEEKNTSKKITIIGQPGNISTNNLLNQIPKPKKNNNSKNKRNKPKNTKPDTKTLKGGGSAWMASQYSLSLADKSHARTPSFSHSKATPKSVLLNPPNMGLAGSGMGDLYYPFAPAQ
jgi:hypothetical protein